jgi:dienelactone hydrolase
MRSTELLPSGAAIRFKLAPTGVKNPTVILLHGWKGRIFSSRTFVAIRRGLAAAGLNTLSVSLRGHEEADGHIEELSREDHWLDLLDVRSYLQDHPEIDMTRLGALGSSYGGYFMAVLSALVPFKAMVLRAPALYSDEGWDNPTVDFAESPVVWQWRKRFHEAREHVVLRALKDFSGNLLIVASGADDCVPTEVIDSYAAAAERATVERTLFKNAWHRLEGEDRDAYVSLACDWLSKKLV